ncbi:unnamed protein product [Chironomus riparius]|uniref:Peptidoglycan-recognition protein n=1 Tax=Chironomus riparius TaxID=315576 RepID=A0A9P0ITQ8_9DIPT|nr:unnamed protein product [Chironomus riparius]
MKKNNYLIYIVLLDVILYITACPRIISRTQWDGKPISIKMQLIQPAYYFIIHQSSSPICFNQTECSIQMRNIQNFHIHSNGLPDIAYNFCIGQDGNVYEGRGWDVQGGDMSSYNAYAINLCFIGTFDTTMPNFKSFLAAQELILCGISKGKVSSAYSLIAHRQISSSDTNCPGNALFSEVKRNLRFDYNPNQSNQFYF